MKRIFLFGFTFNFEYNIIIIFNEVLFFCYPQSCNNVCVSGGDCQEL